MIVDTLFSYRERVQNTTRSRLEEISIKHLRPASVYHFRVIAYNSFGPGASTETLTVKTHAEEHVPSAPVDVIAYADSSYSIYVSWNPPEIPNGFIKEYIVYYINVSHTEESFASNITFSYTNKCLLCT